MGRQTTTAPLWTEFESNNLGHQIQRLTISLFRPKASAILHRELKDDELALFEFFRAYEDKQQALALLRHLRRYLLNHCAKARFCGILEGYQVCELDHQIPKGGAKRFLLAYLKKHPTSSSEELCKYLHRVKAPLPERWNVKLQKAITDKAKLRQFKAKFHVDRINPDKRCLWPEALVLLREIVDPYISKVRQNARDKQLNNALFFWSEKISQYRTTR